MNRYLYKTNINAVGACTFHVVQQCTVQAYVVMKTASYLVNHAISNQVTIYGVLNTSFLGCVIQTVD